MGWTASEQLFHRVNVAGVKDLLQACVTAGVSRFAHLSSIAVTNHFFHTLDYSEADKLPDWSTYISPYDTSKRLGEEAVLGANGETLSTCALRAGGILVYNPKTILSTWPVA